MPKSQSRTSTRAPVRAPVPHVLAVHLGQDQDRKRVGSITRYGSDKCVFTFSEQHTEAADRPTLSQSLLQSSGELVEQSRASNKMVPPFFANLLPEGQLRKYLAEVAEVKMSDEFSLLHALGADLPGAVVVAPEDVDPAELLAPPPNGPDETEAADPDAVGGSDAGAGLALALRFSLAGIQLKFSAFMKQDGGLTIPAGGVGGHWIAKFPSATYPNVPENEFAMMELARRIGIPVPETRLVPISDVAGLPADMADLVGDLKGDNILAVRRFDRVGDAGDGDNPGDSTTRIHVEDFAQVFGRRPETKYDKASYANLANVLGQLAGADAVKDFIRRLAFSVLVGNGDMHLKNWSLIYRDGRTAVMSEAYDLVATVPYIKSDTLALSFGDSKNIGAITPAQVRRFARKTSLCPQDVWAQVAETAELTLDAWRNSPPSQSLPDDLAEPIGTHIEAVAGAVARAT